MYNVLGLSFPYVTPISINPYSLTSLSFQNPWLSILFHDPFSSIKVACGFVGPLTRSDIYTEALCCHQQADNCRQWFLLSLNLPWQIVHNGGVGTPCLIAVVIILRLTPCRHLQWLKIHDCKGCFLPR